MVSKSMASIQRKLTYDSRCHELAETFLEEDIIGLNHKARCHELATLIQQTIEDWMVANPPVH